MMVWKEVPESHCGQSLDRNSNPESSDYEVEFELWEKQEGTRALFEGSQKFGEFSCQSLTLWKV